MSWLATEYAVIRCPGYAGTARVVKVHGALGPALEQATALAEAHPADIVTIARQQVFRFGWESLPDGAEHPRAAP